MLSFSCVPANADNFLSVELVSVYDADTITVNLPCDVELFCNNTKVRLAGIDTPEIRTKNICEKTKAIKARDYVRKLLEESLDIDLIDCTKGKYFRILCSISINKGDLTNLLLEKRYGYPYDGKTKRDVDWCYL